MMAPQAQHREPTCVGMCPPRVGLPITKPPEPTTAFTASSVLSTSRLMVSTPTPALVMPLLIACRTVGEALELHPLQLFHNLQICSGCTGCGGGGHLVLCSILVRNSLHEGDSLQYPNCCRAHVPCPAYTSGKQNSTTMHRQG